MNRFVEKSKQNKILEDLENGKIDILFGTHRILSDDVKFKDLDDYIVRREMRTIPQIFAVDGEDVFRRER